MLAAEELVLFTDTEVSVDSDDLEAYEAYEDSKLLEIITSNSIKNPALYLTALNVSTLDHPLADQTDSLLLQFYGKPLPSCLKDSIRRDLDGSLVLTRPFNGPIDIDDLSSDADNFQWMAALNNSLKESMKMADGRNKEQDIGGGDGADKKKRQENEKRRRDDADACGRFMQRWFENHGGSWFMPGYFRRQRTWAGPRLIPDLKPDDAARLHGHSVLSRPGHRWHPGNSSVENGGGNVMGKAPRKQPPSGAKTQQASDDGEATTVPQAITTRKKKRPMSSKKRVAKTRPEA
jgi:hypothetical protein